MLNLLLLNYKMKLCLGSFISKLWDGINAGPFIIKLWDIIDAGPFIFKSWHDIHADSSLLNYR